MLKKSGLLFVALPLLVLSCQASPMYTSPLPTAASVPTMVPRTLPSALTPTNIPNATSQVSTTKNQIYGEGDIYFAMSQNGNDQIYKLSLKNQSVTRITTPPNNYFSAIVSPDQKWIAMGFSESQPNRSEIALLNLADGTVRKLTNFGAITLSPAWFPDSKKIMFHSNKDGEGRFKIYSVNIDGSDLAEWKTNIDVGNQFMPRITSDGSRVFFVGDRTGVFEILSANIDGSNVRALVATPNRFETQPAITEDGSLLAFTSFRLSNEMPIVFVAHGDGSGATAPFGTNTASTFPCFSPDNKFVASVYNPPGKWQIVIRMLGSNDPSEVVYESLTKIDYLTWARSR